MINISATPSFKPPLATFDFEDSLVTSPHSNGNKSKAKKGKKTSKRYAIPPYFTFCFASRHFSLFTRIRKIQHKSLAGIQFSSVAKLYMYNVVAFLELHNFSLGP